MSTQAKKMFDDVSSDGKGDGDNNSESSTSYSSSSAHAAAHSATQQQRQQRQQHVDPVVTPPAAATEGDSTSAVPPTATAGDVGGTHFIKTVQTPPSAAEAEEKEAEQAKPKAATTAATAAAKGKTDPAAAAPGASTPAPTAKERSAAATPSATTRASLDTPATVSKRPEREEREGYGGGNSGTRHHDSARKPSAAARYKVPATADADEPAFSTRKASQQRPSTSSRRNLDFQQNESNLNHYGDSDDDGEREAALPHKDLDEAAADVFEQLVAPYLFPRLDADLADWDEPERESVVSHEKLVAMRRDPPNCMESTCAYLLATDRRLAIYFLLLCVATVFTIVSIPTSQIDLSSTELLREISQNMVLTPDGVYNFTNVANVKSCYTYWGYKQDCDSAPYTLPVSLMWCTAIRTRLQAGAAFSIISLFVYMVLIVMTTIVMCCLTESPRVRDKNRRKNTKSRWIIGGVGIFCFITQLICWAAMAGIYSSDYCIDEPTDPSGDSTGVTIDNTNKAYGVGFGLSLTAWCLHTLALVQLLAIPGRIMNK